MLHVRTLRDAFLADILMNLRKLILLFILCFKFTKNITILTIFSTVI